MSYYNRILHEISKNFVAKIYSVTIVKSEKRKSLKKYLTHTFIKVILLKHLKNNNKTLGFPFIL